MIALSTLLLGFRVFFSKNERFPSTHIGDNKELRRRGIYCMSSQDLQEQNKKNIFEL